jgi:methionine aminopeptidase
LTIRPVGSTTAFAAGDVITIDGPATADGTLADIAITIAGMLT